MLAGIGETLQLQAELLDDLRTAVSEACNNVVLHAYGAATGPLSVDCQIESDEILIWVRDRGEGIRGIAARSDRMGVGLAVISALADEASFSSHEGGGTEVRMAFGRNVGKFSLAAAGELNGGVWSNGIDGAVAVQITPTELFGNVFGRMTRAIAAQSRFSVDRLSDLYPVAEAISAHARTAATDSRIGFAVDAQLRRLELIIGPFRSGTSSSLESELPGGSKASPLGSIAEEVAARAQGDSELLHVVLADQRPV
jgi:serine/threonine-protein kinase RsbW